MAHEALQEFNRRQCGLTRNMGCGFFCEGSDFCLEASGASATYEPGLRLLLTM